MSAPPTASNTSAPAVFAAGAAPMLLRARDTSRVPPLPAPAQDLDPLAVDPDELPAAAAFLASLLRAGFTFGVLDGRHLVWVGPRVTTLDEWGRLLLSKSETIYLLRHGPRSQRSWGEPTSTDWIRFRQEPAT
jgi:hypothetical protein